MTARDDPDPLKPYRDVVSSVGPTFEALLWHNKDFQERRFRVITELVDTAGRVVADIGCGRADLAAHMHHRGIEYGRYVGVDGVSELVAFCRERARREPLPECEFIEADFSRDEGLFASLVRSRGVEVFAFSGSLNTFEQDAALGVLARAWEALAGVRGGALVFNFLSNRFPVPRRDEPGPAKRFDPLAMLGWALERTGAGVLRQDYLPGHDATVLMRVE